MTVTAGTPSFEELFDPAFLARLPALSLRVAQAQKGGRLADQRTAARGQGTDFSDFKPYVAGDDLRGIDWNIYRRLGKTFVRVFEERQDLPVYLLVDISGSMFVEVTPRIGAALRTALAVGAVALERSDAVSLLPFADAAAWRLRGLSGRANVARLAHALAEARPDGGTGLAAALTQVGAMKLRRGLVVVVSDFFDPAGIETVTRALGRLPHRLLLAQIVRAQDADPTLDPELAGDVLIDDGEGDAAVSLAITPQTIDRYRALYRDFTETLSGFAASRGAALVRIDADRDVIDQLAPVLGGGTVAL
jgi:uncharacterized protein (DUF58 family)